MLTIPKWGPNSWMVYFMENPMKMDDDVWGTPISENLQMGGLWLLF